MKTKCMAILGAGPGLGLALARRYGQDGYAVALVGRRAGVLKAQSHQLIAEGVAAQGFRADLRNPVQVSAVIADILSRFGHIDVLYYGPNAPEAFVPASSLGVDDVKDKVELFLYGLVAAVRGVLPSMQAQQQGAILVGLGGSAAVALPFMSGPGPALAAARNYLYSLHGELAPLGIHVAMLTLSAVIQHSGWQEGIQSGRIPLNLPPGFQIPEVSPDVLAGLLQQAALERTGPELTYPPAPTPAG